MFDSWKIDSQGAAGFSRNRYLLAVFGTLALAALAAIAAMSVLAPTAQAQGGTPITDPGAPSGDNIEPDLVQGNPTCAGLGYGTRELKVEPVNAGTYTLGGFSVTLSNVGEPPPDPPETGPEFDFAANMGVDAVIVKGGDAADSYVYTPEDNADTKLHAPVNPQNGKYFGLSHVSFCVDFELGVTKDAITKFTRTYAWDIAKSNNAPNPIVLSPGQQHTVTYTVTVSNTGSADSDFAVEGTIKVKNFAPVKAEGVQVTDVITPGGAGVGPVQVDCNGATAGNGLPAEVPAGANGVPGELTCTYTSVLPDKSSRTNTATATTTTAGIGNGSGTADIVFANTPTTEKDKCVGVTDTMGGNLGQVCLNDLTNGSKAITYTKVFDADELQCGQQTVPNTATSTTNDNGVRDTATSNVVIDVRCAGGCTLTQGYWKTHSRQGPAPYDDTWALLGAGQENTPFFSSGKSYYQVLWTAPQGNVYYILAQQYIAAKLNALNGASTTPAVDAAITAAESFFATKTPTSSLTKAERAAAIANATTLDNYNNGVVGPGHCSEQNSA
jgi:hypothetical protein